MTGFVVQGHILEWFLKDHDTEDWSHGCWKFSFAIIEINHISNMYLNRKLSYLTTLLFFALFFNMVSFQKHWKIFPTPNFWMVVYIENKNIYII